MSQPALHSDFRASLNYRMRSCLRKLSPPLPNFWGSSWQRRQEDYKSKRNLVAREILSPSKSEAMCMESLQDGSLDRSWTKTTAGTLTWMGDIPGDSSLTQRMTGHEGTRRVGEAVFPGKSTPVGSPIPNGQP